MPDDSAPDTAGSRLDHLNLAVPDLARSLAFYEPALASIGIEKVLVIPPGELPEMHGFGTDRPFFWLIADGRVGTNMHLAFAAATREHVDRFYDTALAVGGTSLHAPAVHPEYHPQYYGAFLLDPDGINVEAVCHRPAPVE